MELGIPLLLYHHYHDSITLLYHIIVIRNWTEIYAVTMIALV